MSKKDKNALKYNHGEKSITTLFIIYRDKNSLLEKIDTCNSDPELINN